MLYLERYVKKKQSQNFMSAVGFQGFKTWMLLKKFTM